MKREDSSKGGDECRNEMILHVDDTRKINLYSKLKVKERRIASVDRITMCRRFVKSNLVDRGNVIEFLF